MKHWDHLEALLAALYAKEVDSEENIWRSLPFFSATLALEVAVVIQFLGRTEPPAAALPWPVLVAAALIILLIAGVVFFLYRSIRPDDFVYIASEPDLVAYVQALEQHAGEAAATEEGSEALKRALQRMLVDQYAAATAANRRSNQRRAEARARAGVLVLASILATLALVGATMHAQMSEQAPGGERDARAGATRRGEAVEAAPAAAHRAVDREGAPTGDAPGQEGLDLPGGPAQR